MISVWVISDATDKPKSEREFLYREFPAYGGQQSIRLGDWKAIRRNLIPNKNATSKELKPTFELFNLVTDPWEEQDGAASHPDIVARLTEIMRQQHTPSKEFPFEALDQ